MPYHIQTVNESGILLKKSAVYPVFFWLMLLSGICMLLPSLLLLAAGEVKAIELFIGGMGLTFFSGAFLLRGMSKKIPSRIFFNHARETVEFQNGGGILAEIGYGEIDQFASRYNRKQGYTVYLQRKNGGIWTLISTSTQSGAEKALRLLKDHVGLTSDKVADRPAAPKWLTETATAEGKAFLWKEKNGPGGILLFLMLLLGLAACFSGGLMFQSLTGKALPVVWAGFSILAAFGIIHSIRTKMNYRVLAFSPTKTVFGSARNIVQVNTQRWKIEKSIAMESVVSVNYSYDENFDTYQIRILDASGRHAFEQMQGGNVQLPEILEDINNYRKLFAIPFPDKAVTDILTMERWITEPIRTFGGLK